MEKISATRVHDTQHHPRPDCGHGVHPAGPGVNMDKEWEQAVRRLMQRGVGAKSAASDVDGGDHKRAKHHHNHHHHHHHAHHHHAHHGHHHHKTADAQPPQQPAEAHPLAHAHHIGASAPVMHNNGAKSAGATAIAPHAAVKVVKPGTLAKTSPVSNPVSAGRPAASTAPPEPTGIVDVNKTIIVHAGETFDGGGQYYRPTNALGDGGVSETQLPVFIVESGGKLKNVQYSGADGIHLMGDAKLDNVVNRDVGEDAITIDGDANRAVDAQRAGVAATALGRPAEVEITNSSFYHAHDKVIQTNGDANVKLEGIRASDVGQLMVTSGGKPITAHVDFEDSVLRDVKYDVFRFDSHTSSVNFKNDDTGHAGLEAMMGDTSKATGAASVRQSTDTV